jgi:poly(A) polymerase
MTRRQDTHDDLRTIAVQIVRTLTEAGHVAYFAGGCVRDCLMGHSPDDYDIATDARPEAVGGLFRNAHYVGESFGVTLIRRRGHMIHVATFRTDGVYSDGRHPDSVDYTDAEHDAARRDFTINGLFENPLTGDIIDHVGGKDDLEKHVIRAIGAPEARLREDALRMLRAVRFAARFEFNIDAATADAIRSMTGDLRGVSRERIGDELKRMLSNPNRARAAMELQNLGLDQAVLDGAHRTATPTRLNGLPADAPYPTALAAWLLDRAEPGDEPPMDRALRWSRAVLLSNTDQHALCRTLQIHATLLGDWPSLGVAAQKRLAAQPEFEQALAILRSAEQDTWAVVRDRRAELALTNLAPTPLITGDDLIELGLEPGPIFRNVLNAVYDAQLEGGLESRDEALKLARAIHKSDDTETEHG